jgi:hypothetical protein
MFKQPFPIDRSKLLTVPTPPSFKSSIEGKTIQVLPLVPTTPDKDNSRAGWCTYTQSDQSPEMEILCGGINAKYADAGAIWRFSEDRPIPATPSPFTAKHRVLQRLYVDRKVETGSIEREYLARFVDADSLRDVSGATPEELAAWWKQHRSHLRPKPNSGVFELDRQLLSLGASYDDLDSLLKATAGVLVRYLPDGPVDSRDSATWRAWITKHRPWLFFSELGGFRWHLDPLAQKRGVPSSRLQGEARASRPWPKRIK